MRSPATRMYERLKALQWVGPTCPTCGALFRSGHEDDCEIAALLSDLEGTEIQEGYIGPGRTGLEFAGMEGFTPGKGSRRVTVIYHHPAGEI